MLSKIAVFNTEHSETTTYVTVSRILPNAKESAVYRGNRSLVRPYLILCHPDYVGPTQKSLKLFSGKHGKSSWIAQRKNLYCLETGTQGFHPHVSPVFRDNQMIIATITGRSMIARYKRVPPA